MSVLRIFVVAALTFVGACQTTQTKTIWSRTDGKKIAGDIRLQQQFDIDKTVCIGETQKSAVGMAPIYYSGIGGAINAGMIENQRQSALIDVAKGCMASKGYISQQVPAA